MMEPPLLKRLRFTNITFVAPSRSCIGANGSGKSKLISLFRLHNAIAAGKLCSGCRQRKVRSLGRHIVADPAICHGKPTFRGTRTMVWQVLEMVAEGMDFYAIVKAWGEVRSPARRLQKPPNCLALPCQLLT